MTADLAVAGPSAKLSAVGALAARRARQVLGAKRWRTGGLAPWAADLRGPVCLVLGGEGEGLRPLVARSCDALVTIPMQGRVGSLNVAAAGAVLCYEVSRQREALKRKTP